MASGQEHRVGFGSSCLEIVRAWDTASEGWVVGQSGDSPSVRSVQYHFTPAGSPGQGPMIEVQLGASLRRLRSARKLSLRNLAERTGFSASFLSQVENGQASPSIASMERIAAALGVTMGQFFQATESSPQAVVRAMARVALNSQWSRARIEALSAAVTTSRIEPVLITLEAGGTSGAHPHTSTREEFAFVLDGSVVLTLAETQQVLGCGDAAMIDAGVPRRWQNLEDGPVQILVVSVH